jgi:hypothetical protein
MNIKIILIDGQLENSIDYINTNHLHTQGNRFSHSSRHLPDGKLIPSKFGSTNNMHDLSISMIGNSMGGQRFSNVNLNFSSFKNPNQQQQPMSFKRFTYKIQGRDEEGNDLKKDIIPKDLNLSNGSLLEDLQNLSAHSDYALSDTEEQITDKKQIIQYNQKKFIKSNDLNTANDKINLKALLHEYYKEEINQNENEVNKIDQLVYEMEKLKKKEEKVRSEKEKYESMRNKFTLIKQEANKELSLEREKLQKLQNLKLSKINDYDKIIVTNGGDKNIIDFEKYIYKTEEDEEKNLKKSFLKDKQKIYEEIEDTRKEYEQKANKYKDILRKLKVMIINKTNENNRVTTSTFISDK